MQKKEELVKFNLTQDMSIELIKFNNLKKELFNLKKMYNDSHDKNILTKILDMEHELQESKNRFIREFRLNNQDEIARYLQLKDQL